MIWVVTFWCLLAVPGLALVARCWPRLLRSGPLGAVGFGYLATIALASPLALLGYSLELPLYVLTAAMVGLVGVGAFDLWKRYRPLSVRWRRPRFELEVSALVLVVLVALRVGSPLIADANFHVGRVRMLVDLGFNNHDPFVWPHAFSPAYHTNVYHALLGVCSQVTGEEPFVVWRHALVLSKVLLAASTYCTTWLLFQQRVVAWFAVVVHLAMYLGTEDTALPRMLAPGFMVVMSVGLAGHALRTRRWKTPVVTLGLTAFATGQIHSLYGVFAAILVLPGVAAWCIARRQPLRGVLIAAALATAAPFVVVAHLGGTSGVSEEPSTTSQVEREALTTPSEGSPAEPAPKGLVVTGLGKDRFVQTTAGRHMLDPRPLLSLHRGSLDGHSISPGAEWLLLPSLLVLYWRRHHAAWLGWGVACVLAVSYVPPLCTAALQVFSSRGWILLRLWEPMYFLCPVLTSGAAFVAVPKLSRRRWRAVALPLAVVAVHLFAGESWLQLWEDRTVEDRREARAVKTLAGLRRHVPAGSVAATELKSGRYLGMLHHVYSVAVDRGSPRIRDLPQRQDDLAALLSPSTNAPERMAIAQRYRVTRVLLKKESRRPLKAWLKRETTSLGRVGAWECYGIDAGTSRPRGARSQ